jgi:hypothetical protein
MHKFRFPCGLLTQIARNDNTLLCQQVLDLTIISAYDMSAQAHDIRYLNQEILLMYREYGVQLKMLSSALDPLLLSILFVEPETSKPTRVGFANFSFGCSLSLIGSGKIGASLLAPCGLSFIFFKLISWVIFWIKIIFSTHPFKPFMFCNGGDVNWATDACSARHEPPIHFSSIN